MAFHPRPPIASDLGRNVTRSFNPHRNRNQFPSGNEILAYGRRFKSQPASTRCDLRIASPTRPFLQVIWTPQIANPQAAIAELGPPGGRKSQNRRPQGQGTFATAVVFYNPYRSQEKQHPNYSRGSELAFFSKFRVPQKEVGKRGLITFFVFGTLSVAVRSLFLMLLSLFSSLFCQTPFAGLFLWQGEKSLHFKFKNH